MDEWERSIRGSHGPRGAEDKVANDRLRLVESHDSTSTDVQDDEKREYENLPPDGTDSAEAAVDVSSYEAAAAVSEGAIKRYIRSWSAHTALNRQADIDLGRLSRLGLPILKEADSAFISRSPRPDVDSDGTGGAHHEEAWFYEADESKQETNSSMEEESVLLADEHMRPLPQRTMSSALRRSACDVDESLQQPSRLSSTHGSGLSNAPDQDDSKASEETATGLDNPDASMHHARPETATWLASVIGFFRERTDAFSEEEQRTADASILELYLTLRNWLKEQTAVYCYVMFLIVHLRDQSFISMVPCLCMFMYSLCDRNIRRLAVFWKWILRYCEWMVSLRPR